RADIYVMDFPLLDTRKKDNDLTGTFIADLVLQILSYVAQTEREFIHQRQSEGIALAKKNGVQFGRKRVKLPKAFNSARDKVLRGEYTFRQAADACGMKTSTFYNYYKQSLNDMENFK
ncbi:MAG: recombinase family protein, partial [Acutalibacteraceae bacterium]